jgi:GNAT superfamily N-acetyltransferase
MIIFRKLDYEKDLEEVVLLIKNNLDDNYTIEFLNWKHYSNPSGKSLSMVAVEDNQIVGVIFYMVYNFSRKGEQIIRSIRPVDGCTEKKYRGKGIYKKLMSSCLELYNNMYDILIATPNKNSYAETIKLGWRPLNKKYYYKLGFIFPLKFSKSLTLKPFDSKGEYNVNLNSHNHYVSGNTLDYIKWRFKDKSYIIKQFNSNANINYVIYRIDNVKNIKCIILCDFIGDNQYIDNAIRTICKLEKLYLVYFLDNYLNKNIKFLLKVTHREASIVYKENDYNLNDNLVLTLADLEGKI